MQSPFGAKTFQADRSGGARCLILGTKVFKTQHTPVILLTDRHMLNVERQTLKKRAFCRKKFAFQGKLQREFFCRFLGKTSLKKNFQMKSGVGGDQNG